MIDIHTHILPMVDDGASSIETALKLLVDAYEDGSDEIVLTPHFAQAYGFDNPKDKISALFEDFKYIVKQERIPLELYLGCEYLYTTQENFFMQKEEMMTLNHTDYMLMEFFFDIEAEKILEAVETVTQEGWIPILAHPERYDSIQMNPEMAKLAVEKGALLQMNKGSVMGKYGSLAQDTAMELLESHAYSFVGSDAHHPLRRSSRMYEAYQMVKESFGSNYADLIFKENAKKMLKNEDIRKKDGYEK